MADRLPGPLRRAWRYIRAEPSRQLIVGLAVVFGALTGIPTGQVGYEYMWLDARFCDDCHVHDYANQGWARSLHGDVTTCHDCHRVPIRHYPRNLWLTAFDRPVDASDIHPPDVATVICEQCHSAAGSDEPLTGPLDDATRARVVKIDHSPLHQRHLEATSRTPSAYLGGDHGTEGSADAHERPDHGDAEDRITCMDCHGAESNRAHRFQATLENCVTCHAGTELPAGRLQLVSCRECHFEGFLGTLADGVADPDADGIGPHTD